MGTLEEASAISIYKRKAPSSVPPTSLPFPQKWPLRATEEARRPPHSCTPRESPFPTTGPISGASGMSVWLCSIRRRRPPGAGTLAAQWCTGGRAGGRDSRSP